MLFRLETDSGNVVKKPTATQKTNDFFFLNTWSGSYKYIAATEFNNLRILLQD